MAGVTPDEAEGATFLGDIESSTPRLAAMKEKGIISEDEYSKLSKKELGID